MTNEEYLTIKQNVLGAIDKAIKDGDWQASLFFQNIGKRLHELRENVAKELAIEEKHQHTEPKHVVDIKPGFTKIYVSLYQADSDNLDRWQHAIKMLSEYNISRPVYSAEEHIREMIRAKADAKHEAYVVVSVPQNCVIDPIPGQPLEDKFGNRLLSLKERSVKLENIIEFVHMEKRYRLREGRLENLA